MLDNEALTQGTVTAMGTVLETQDGPMIEAQQRAMGTSDKFLDMKPAILRADTAGVAARRILKRRLDAEAPEAVAQPEMVAAE